MSSSFGTLYNACSRGDLEKVKSQLEKEASQDRKTFQSILEMREAGHTPLLIAVENGHADVVEFLYAKGASMNAKLNHGPNALQLAIHLKKENVARVLIQCV